MFNASYCCKGIEHSGMMGLEKVNQALNQLHFAARTDGIIQSLTKGDRFLLANNIKQLSSSTPQDI